MSEWFQGFWTAIAIVLMMNFSAVLIFWAVIKFWEMKRNKQEPL